MKFKITFSQIHKKVIVFPLSSYYFSCRTDSDQNGCVQYPSTQKPYPLSEPQRWVVHGRDNGRGRKEKDTIFLDDYNHKVTKSEWMHMYDDLKIFFPALSSCSAHFNKFPIFVSELSLWPTRQWQTFSKPIHAAGIFCLFCYGFFWIDQNLFLLAYEQNYNNL